MAASLGKIPANRLYQPGLKILNLFPMPTIDNVPAGQNYNYELVRPERALGCQPALRLDYQASQSLRASFKCGWFTAQADLQRHASRLERHADAESHRHHDAATVNYTLTPTMFLEATYGHSQNELAGCALARAPARASAGTPSGEPDHQSQQGRARRHADAVPGCAGAQSSYYAYSVLERISRRSGRTARC